MIVAHRNINQLDHLGNISQKKIRIPPAFNQTVDLKAATDGNSGRHRGKCAFGGKATFR